MPPGSVLPRSFQPYYGQPMQPMQPMQYLEEDHKVNKIDVDELQVQVHEPMEWRQPMLPMRAMPWPILEPLQQPLAPKSGAVAEEWWSGYVLNTPGPGSPYDAAMDHFTPEAKTPISQAVQPTQRFMQQPMLQPTQPAQPISGAVQPIMQQFMQIQQLHEVSVGLRLNSPTIGSPYDPALDHYTPPGATPVGGAPMPASSWSTPSSSGSRGGRLMSWTPMYQVRTPRVLRAEVDSMMTQAMSAAGGAADLKFLDDLRASGMHEPQ
jgi:hypothetical protein